MDINICEEIKCAECAHKKVCFFKNNMDSPTLNIPNNIENIEVKVSCKFFLEAKPVVRKIERVDTMPNLDLFKPSSPTDAARPDWQGFEGTVVRYLRNPPMCEADDGSGNVIAKAAGVTVPDETLEGAT